MILTCPECATSYFVDDSRIAAAGRTVKCSNCGARWTALPEKAEETLSPTPKSAPAPTPPSAVDELVIDGLEPAAEPIKSTRSAPPRRKVNGKVIVWAASAVVAALVIAGVIIFRAPIVQRLPASQAAYAGLGLRVSALAIERVHADPGFQGGRPVLSVTGQIRNLGEASASVPPVRVTLLDRLGKPVATKIAKPIEETQPGHSVRYFAITLVDPPANLHDLDVAFETPGKGAAKPAKPVKAQVSAPAAASTPQPVDAKALPPGSPDALPAVPK